MITWSGPPLMPKPTKNRLHFDIAATADASDQLAEVDRLIDPRRHQNRHRSGRRAVDRHGRP